MRTFTGQRPACFALFAALLVCAEWGVTRSSLLHRSSLIPWAVACDLLCVLPGMYALLVLRPASRPLSELAPVILVTTLLASWLLGQESQLRVPLYVLGAVAEVGCVAAFSLHLIKQRSQPRRERGDLLLHVQTLENPVARFVGLELCVLYYACIAPRRSHSGATHDEAAPTAVRTFYHGSQARQTLAMIGVASVMEAIPLHFLLSAYTPRLSWVVLALSAYGLLWVVGAYRALRLRPLLVYPEHVLLRLSLLSSADVKRSELLSIEPCATSALEPGVTRMTLASRPNLLIQLRSPVRVYGFLGRSTYTTRIAIAVEQPEQLIHALTGQDEC